MVFDSLNAFLDLATISVMITAALYLKKEICRRTDEKTDALATRINDVALRLSSHLTESVSLRDRLAWLEGNHSERRRYRKQPI